ncbi:MAG: hypothetical protein HY675_03240 [Chloroflexi bacterium]|nr:hypothetical protein [Chloroflexota bacterium]
MNITRILIGAIAVSVMLSTMAFPAFAAKPTAGGTSIIVVTPGDLAADSLESDLLEKYTAYLNGKWFFYNDETDVIDNSLGSFVVGPGTPPMGLGGTQISVSGTQRRNLATYRFSGTRLADITTLAFSTYNPSAGNGGPANRSGYLNFNVDFNGSDTWQRRLVFTPPPGQIVQNLWQEWDAIKGGSALWHYSGSKWPNTNTPGSTAKNWAQILSQYPGIRVRVTDSWLGIRVGSPYPNGYTENVDAFKFGTAAGTTVFDFEPGADFCKDGGWQNSSSPNFRNQGDCVSYVQSNVNAIGNKSK